jgi:glycyl-tRNA synthetase beta chain
MADLLLELFSEEIPARMQADAVEHLRESLVNALRKNGLDDGKIAFQARSYVTPRRLAVWLNNLPIASESTETELKGPKVGAPDAAVQGFLKKTGLAQKDLTERDGVYFAIVRKEGQQTADLLKSAIEHTLASFPWPKSMRWGSGEATWVRPLHSILCIFDGKVIPVSFAGVTAGNTTRGHRFLAPDAITINSPADYEAALKKAYVLADREARKAEILKQAEAAAKGAGLVLKKDEGLLEEVTGLVEWPTVLVGTIDAKYMDLPKEVLVSEMRAHQKYFALEKADGALSDKFLITSNMIAKDGGKAIIAGNERVLRARLADGRFFWDTDRKKTLDAWAEGLKTVTYHAKLGSIADKVERITALAVKLADSVKADKKLTERAARLCKADLVTGMVGEFPELQGVMGRYYAAQQKEDAAVADAIRDHYLPLGPTTDVPKQPVSYCVALADKLDTLVSMFAIGEKPTGSKDPFALRRAALGVIRIVLENNIRLPLKDIFAEPPVKAIALHSAHKKLVEKTEAALHAPDKVGKYLTVNEVACEDKPVADDLSAMLYDFFIDRLKVQLKDQGIRHDVISAVVANGDDDLVRIVERAKAVQDFLATEDGKSLLAGYKRAANILAIEEKKDNRQYNKPVNSDELKLAEELMLNQSLSQTTLSVTSSLEDDNFTAAMSVFSKLRTPVDAFFDKVMVNDTDAKTRELRLNLLSRLKRTLNAVADFSLIEGDTKEQKKKAA